jgi:transcriptional regulator with XRE-family HTH domain
MPEAVTIPAVAEQSELFGPKLRKALTRWHGSQRDLADALGVRRQTFQHYLSGSVPKLQTLCQLARLLDVDLDWLIDDQRGVDEPAKLSGHERVRRENPHVVADVAAENYRKHAAELDRAIEKMHDPDWDGIAIWLLWTGPAEQVPEPMRDALKLLWGVDSILYAVRSLDVVKKEAIAAAGERVEPGYAAANLERSKLEDLLRGIEDNEFGITALGEFMHAVPVDWMRRTLAAEGSAKPFGIFPFKSRPVENVDEFKAKRVPYLLAKLVSDPGYIGRPKLQPIVKQLTEQGYLNKDGEPVSIPGYDFDVGDRQGWQ